jgi:hypothetical protein
MHSRLPHLSLLVVIMALVAACAPAALPPTSPPASPSPAAPTATSPVPAPPVATSVPPTDTPSAINVQVFLIALEDNGQSGELVGCGDSAIPVQVTTAPTQGVLRVALEALLSIKEQYYGESGLYNALYQSDLRVEGVTIEDGLATIHLSGTMTLGGVCDNPRVQAQIEETALQFSTVSDVAVFVNDVPLEEVLSEK